LILERIGDLFEEDKTKDDALVFRRVHVVAQLVALEPLFFVVAFATKPPLNYQYESAGSIRDNGKIIFLFSRVTPC